MIDRLLRFIEPELQQKGVEMHSALSEDLPEILFDNEQIYQVILNIVINAIQAMPEGGRITLTTAEQADGVVLEITDTGLGIPPENIEQVFTPFYTGKNRGTGLGLSIAKSIVDKHHGTLTVDSSVGEGSTFRLTLPEAMEHDICSGGNEEKRTSGTDRSLCQRTWIWPCNPHHRCAPGSWSAHER